MFRVDTRGNTLTVYLDERPVIVHTPDAPFAWAGKGKWRAADETVSDTVSEHSPLTRAQYDSNWSLLRLSGGDFSLTFHLSESDGVLTLAPQRSTSGLNRLKLVFPARPEQEVFGGGAQYKSLNLRGKRIPLWVREQRVLERSRVWPAVRLKGHSAHPSYFPLPVFFTKELDWYYFDCGSPMVFDFKNQKHHTVEFWDLPGSVVIGRAENPLDIPANFSKIGGRQPMLPQWMLEGACIEVQGGSRVLADQLEKVVNAGAAVSSILLRDWSGHLHASTRVYPFFDWIWNRELYPRLDLIISELANRNIRLLAYVNPHLSIEGRLYAEASMAGYLVKKPRGGSYISDMGGFMVGHLDLTNPNACRWYKEIIKQNILGVGFCGYLADKGNFLPHDAILSSGESALKLHNRWPVLWAKLNREAVREAGRTIDTAFYSIAGWTGSGQQSMLVSTGDYHTGWGKENGLPSALTSSLSLSCSGVGISQADCGGNISYLLRRNKELMLRWMDYSVFTPVFRVVIGQKENWQIDSDNETLSHFAKMSRAHAALGPYMRACVKEAASSGYPVMRALFMCFPDDEEACGLYDSYMLGSELLVSPVLTRGEKKHKVYLPEGRWIHLWSGKEYPAGKHLITTVFGRTPAFYKLGGKYQDLFAELPGKV